MLNELIKRKPNNGLQAYAYFGWAHAWFFLSSSQYSRRWRILTQTQGRYNLGKISIRRGVHRRVGDQRVNVGVLWSWFKSWLDSNEGYRCDSAFSERGRACTGREQQLRLDKVENILTGWLRRLGTKRQKRCFAWVIVNKANEQR